jgi:hypothetical protein
MSLDRDILAVSSKENEWEADDIQKANQIKCGNPIFTLTRRIIHCRAEERGMTWYHLCLRRVTMGAT